MLSKVNMIFYVYQNYSSRFNVKQNRHTFASICKLDLNDSFLVPDVCTILHHVQSLSGLFSNTCCQYWSPPLFGIDVLDNKQAKSGLTVLTYTCVISN